MSGGKPGLEPAPEADSGSQLTLWLPGLGYATVSFSKRRPAGWAQWDIDPPGAAPVFGAHLAALLARKPS